MSADRRHESADLEDYEVLGAFDTLDGPPGDDPLDRGVVTPDRWSAAMKFGSTAAEQEAGESLDQLLAEEEPDVMAADDDWSEDSAGDENAPDEDVGRFSLSQGPDPRSGRLIADDAGAFPAIETDLLANDAGIDGGGATAEEAAVHVLLDSDTGLSSGEKQA